MSLYKGLKSPIKFTSKLYFTKDTLEFPIFQRLSSEGKLFGDPTIPSDQLKSMFDQMVRVSVYDQYLYDIQRQGRISFYMQNSGEEGLQIASAAGLSQQDMVWPQYREMGVFLYRGFSVQQMVDQCMSTKDDPGKGRQMPVHYCYPEQNIQVVSSPIATQIIHAAGAGYAFKLDREGGQTRDDSSRLSVAYFGEGASSEGDFAVALNFAAVRKSNTLFLCRNNGYAISTPVKDQFVSDGVAVRGPGHGLLATRVDGNDVFAVYDSVKKAREMIISEKSGPILIEFMTYRKGHHSTSDDSSRYRDKSESEIWLTGKSGDGGLDPISRLKKYLVDQKIVNTSYEEEVRQTAKTEVLAAIKTGEKKKRASIDFMFKDVYSDPMPWHLKEQMEGIKKHLEFYSDKYPDFQTKFDH
jgi:2-oxoisovalerate dehydrogenase E1 component alpha subunit